MRFQLSLLIKKTDKSACLHSTLLCKIHRNDFLFRLFFFQCFSNEAVYKRKLYNFICFVENEILKCFAAIVNKIKVTVMNLGDILSRFS